MIGLRPSLRTSQHTLDRPADVIALLPAAGQSGKHSPRHRTGQVGGFRPFGRNFKCHPGTLWNILQGN